MIANLIFTGWTALFLFTLGTPAPTATIFVDRNSTAPYEDGTASAPFRTISRALDEARAIRFGSSQDSRKTITVHIAPSTTPYIGTFDPAVFDPSSPSYDPTKERFPLLLNIPHLKLRGGTVLATDGSGLPVRAVAGTETTIRSDRPQTSRQHLIMVTRTLALAGSGFPESLEMSGDDVTITGLFLQAEPGRQLTSALIAIDGVTDFVVRANALAEGGHGVWTRLSSGRIKGNLVSNNTTGLYLTGGSLRFPASLKVVENRVSGGNSVTGMGLVGGAETSNLRTNLDFGAHKNRFARVPLPLFDREASPDEVPDTLTARVVGNMFDRHDQGIRTVGFLQHPYELPTGQDETAQVTAIFRNNQSSLNRLYGMLVDAGQIALGDRRIVRFSLSFDETTLHENALGPALFSLWRIGGSIAPPEPNPFLQPNPTFAHDSSIQACGDVTRFHFDNRQDPHPPTNPAPTNNVLTVNGVQLTGLSVATLFEVPPSSSRCARRRVK